MQQQPTPARSDAPPACPELAEGTARAPLPSWATPYLTSLHTSFHKPEAIRRATATQKSYPDGKPLRPLCSIGSDRLLLRLLEHYLPGFAPHKRAAARPEQAQRAERSSRNFPASASLLPVEQAEGEDAKALQKQNALLTRENNNHKYQRRQLETRLADNARQCEHFRRMACSYRQWNDQLKNTLTAVGLQVPLYQTLHSAEDHPDPEPIPQAPSSQKTTETPPQTTKHTISPSTPLSPLSPILPSPTTAPNPPEFLTEESIAREMAKYNHARARLNAEHQQLLKEGCSEKDKRVLANRASFYKLHDLFTLISGGITFEQALAEAHSLVAQPP